MLETERSKRKRAAPSDRIPTGTEQPNPRDSPPELNARTPPTVRLRRDWIMLFVVRVNVNREPLDRVVDKRLIVLSETIWIHRMPFVVKGSANVVYAMIIVVKT